MNSIRTCVRAAFVVLVFALQAAVPAPAMAQAVSPPAAAAAAEQYRLALGDTIRISVFQSPDLSLEARITEAGVISYPLLGSVSLSGLTVAEAEQRIANGLRTGNFVKQPQVSITVVQARGNQVSVLGQVGRDHASPRLVLVHWFRSKRYRDRRIRLPIDCCT